MSSEPCVHSALPFNITCARDPTLSASEPVTKETASLVLGLVPWLTLIINYPSPLAPHTIIAQPTSTTFVTPYFFISIREFILILCIYRPTVNGCVQGWQVFAER